MLGLLLMILSDVSCQPVHLFMIPKYLFERYLKIELQLNEWFENLMTCTCIHMT